MSTHGRTTLRKTIVMAVLASILMVLAAPPAALVGGLSGGVVNDRSGT